MICHFYVPEQLEYRWIDDMSKYDRNTFCNSLPVARRDKVATSWQWVDMLSWGICVTRSLSWQDRFIRSRFSDNTIVFHGAHWWWYKGFLLYVYVCIIWLCVCLYESTSIWLSQQMFCFVVFSGMPGLPLTWVFGYCLLATHYVMLGAMVALHCATGSCKPPKMDRTGPHSSTMWTIPRSMNLGKTWEQFDCGLCSW